VECDGWHDLRLTGLLIALALFTLLLHFQVLSGRGDAANVAGAAVRIGLFYIQVAVLLSDTAGIGAIDFLRPINFDLFGSTDCVSTSTDTQMLILPLLPPYAAFFFLIGFALLHWTLFKLRHRCKIRSALFRRFDRHDYIRTAMALGLVTYSRVAETVFRYMDCTSVLFGGESISLVRTLPAVNCDSTEYRRYYGLVVFILVTHVIMLPFGLVGWYETVNVVERVNSIG